MGWFFTRRDPWEIFVGFHSGFQVIGEILWGWKIQVTWGEFREKHPVIQDVTTRTFVSQSRFEASQTPLANWGKWIQHEKNLSRWSQRIFTFQSKKYGRNPRYSSLPENFSIFQLGGFTTPKIRETLVFQEDRNFSPSKPLRLRRWFNPDASVQVARKPATFHAGLRIWRRLCWKTSILREGAGPCWWEIFGTF